jgi:hypothetical protein
MLFLFQYVSLYNTVTMGELVIGFFDPSFQYLSMQKKSPHHLSMIRELNQ